LWPRAGSRRPRETRGLPARSRAAASALVASLLEGQRFAARASIIRPSVILRADPLVAALAAAEGKTEAELDTFFITYAQV
jgi:hypothetical protein